MNFPRLCRIAFFAFCIPIRAIHAQEAAIALSESFAVGYQYHVQCRVDIKGTLPLPGERDKNGAKLLAVNGTSALEYDERILKHGATPGQVERTIRQYRQLKFERKVGDEDQQNELRREATKLVILRHGHHEVPFCPNTALTWGEIDLVRTDVFVPALQGLLPSQPVKAGERWNASTEAVQELTDLEKITQGQLVCTFDSVKTINQRKLAFITFQGKIQGVSEDGNAAHALEGSLYFDLDDRFLSYLYVKGSHLLLDKEGKETGKVEGSFTLTRSPHAQTKELSDDALRGLTLEPNNDNTLLLFDNAKVGVRLLYPRNWRVMGPTAQGQIGVEDSKGNGMLLSVGPVAGTPSIQQFMHETGDWLKKQNATTHRVDPPRQVQQGIEMFVVDATLNQKRVQMHSYVLRQRDGGATLAATLTQLNAELARDVERIARSVQIRQPQ
jgi:hypothetical protein